MLSRRHFIFLASSAVTLPALTKNVIANEKILLLDNDIIANNILKSAIYDRLFTQFEQAELAEKMTNYILDVGLDWQLPEIGAQQINRIVAYAFGNRPNALSGNSAGSADKLQDLPDPGPTNEKLADTVYEIYQLNPVPIYAQWEIARFLKDKYKLNDINAIEPIKNDDGTITYLSTVGVAEAIIKQEGGADKMGNVAIVAHRDHAKRCILTSKQCGMNAYAVKEVKLPIEYDSQSGQAWTRDRQTYLLHDMYCQFFDLRNERIKKLYPNG